MKEVLLPVLSDYESEAVGLTVRSNWTESESFMRRKVALNEKRLTLNEAKAALNDARISELFYGHT